MDHVKLKGRPKQHAAFWPAAIRRLLGPWLLATTLELLRVPRYLDAPESLADLSLGRVALITVLGAAVLWLISLRWNTACIERWLPAVCFPWVLLSCTPFRWSFLLLCCLVEAVLVGYGILGWDSAPVRYRRARDKNCWAWAVGAMAALFFLLVSFWTLGRVWSFSAPTYDFGIFAQMFHHMRQSGHALTTLERDGLLSHFQVHVSPTWYLLLPVYCLWPRPGTLQVLQAAVMASAVVPLWLIGKELGLKGGIRFLLCAMLLLQPAFAGGAGYDIHENCFLTPLLLWLFWGLQRRNIPIILLALLLTLGVKEDAAVYPAAIGLWLCLRSMGTGRRDLLVGLGILGISIGWFLGVTGYLDRYGLGVMTYRYDNLILDGTGSLVSLIKGVLLCPGKVLYECADPEKLPYLALTLGPLLGLPLMTRRYERLTLLIPWVLVNLMPDYQYQHDLFFQYSFGSCACLVCLTALNLADLRPQWLRLGALAGAVAVSAGCFAATVVPKAVSYAHGAVRYQAYYDGIRQLLDRIPAEASVTANTFYTAYLSQRDTVYDFRYAKPEHLLESDYVVLNLQSESDLQRYGGLEPLVRLLENHGFVYWDGIPDTAAVYVKSP